jgi:metal-dependent HD superfamily phosphatase/phosphodiesterase
MITLKEINNNKQILEFIKKSDESLKQIGYTEHGLKHSQLVSDRARTIAKELGYSKEIQEMAAVSGFCHDMANFLGRKQHHYLGSLLFYATFKDKYSIKELIPIMQAIASHDKDELDQDEVEIVNEVTAILILADKSDVRRSRVLKSDRQNLKEDIHARVNYATKQSKISINKKQKRINLTLTIDTKITPIMEYFEIFTQRMVYCRKAADYLGYRFGLKINNFTLL